jgi:hypothetical protein
MLSLLSIGIEKYHNSLSRIPCAGSDAEKVYKTVSRVMGDSFSESSSICLRDITSTEFHNVLSALSNELSDFQEYNTLVIYFSGHASTDSNGTLSLKFKDNGCSVNTVRDSLAESNFKTLLVLDCCSSGAATDITYSIEPSGKRRLAVLASCQNIETSNFFETGSEFTGVFCDALNQLDKEGSKITVVGLASKIRKIGYTRASVSTGASEEGDFSLRDEVDYESLYDYFRNRFLIQLGKASSLLREALWYSLTDMPLPVCRDVFLNYFAPETLFVPEASWLVRRSIGNALACFDELSDIAKKLIRSLSWQEQCIGVIGLRYKLRVDSRLVNEISSLIKDKQITKIDVIWLVNLYASEHPDFPDLDEIADTDLYKTSWGLIEAYKTTKNRERFMEKHENSEGFTELLKYRELTENKKYRGNRLIAALYEEQSRGKWPTIKKSRYLLSILYGSWRGHTNINLDKYFENTDHARVIQELSAIASLPDVDKKMSVFNYFISNPKSFDIYKAGLRWGIQDKHPWVKRCAAKAYAENKDFLKYETSGIICRDFQGSFSILDMQKELPGHLDYYLECPRTFFSAMMDAIKQEDLLSIADFRSLDASWQLDH